MLPFRAAFYWEYYQDLEMHHSIIEQLEVSRLPHNKLNFLKPCFTTPSSCVSATTVVRWLQVDWMLLIELLIDFFFLADIALNFNTGYIAEQVCHCSVTFPPLSMPPAGGMCDLVPGDQHQQKLE